MLTFEVYTREFLDASARWFADEEIRTMINVPPVTDEQREAFFHLLPTKSDYKIWGVAYNGQPIGACGLRHITQNSAECWCYIGEKEFWGKGLGVAMVDFCIEKAKGIGLSQCYVYVNALNERSVRLHRRCGFNPVESDVNGLEKMVLILQQQQR